MLSEIQFGSPRRPLYVICLPLDERATGSLSPSPPFPSLFLSFSSCVHEKYNRNLQFINQRFKNDKRNYFVIPRHFIEIYGFYIYLYTIYYRVIFKLFSDALSIDDRTYRLILFSKLAYIRFLDLNRRTRSIIHSSPLPFSLHSFFFLRRLSMCLSRVVGLLLCLVDEQNR